jgi:transcriptional regulator with XRE-family HTH domain
MDYGNRIYELRKEKGFSQEKVALELDISRQSVSLWETNQVSPSMENLIAIAKLFNVSLDTLVGIDNKSDIVATPNEELIYRVSYEDNKHSIYRRDYMYITNFKEFLLYNVSLSFLVFSILFFFGAFGVSRDHAKVFVIISLLCFVGVMLVYPFYIFRNIKKKLNRKMKYIEEFYNGHLNYLKSNSIVKEIDYKQINYYIDKTEYILLYVFRGEIIYIPKYNIQGLNDFLSTRIERRTRRKSLWKHT